MKKYLLPVVLCSGLLFACGSEKEMKSGDPAPGMHRLDLSRYGKPFALDVPDTTSAKLLISENPSGALEIQVGRAFAISIQESMADLQLKKEDLKMDEVNKLKSFVIDEPSGILWESGITAPEYHFLLNNKFDNRDFSFEDLRDLDGKPFSKEAVQTMYNSCKNLAPVAQATAS